MRKQAIGFLLFCVFASPVAAQTPSEQCPRAASHAPPNPQAAAARMAQRQACAADMATYCSDIAPGCGRPMQCLRAHSAQLSAGCSNAMKALYNAIHAAPH